MTREQNHQDQSYYVFREAQNPDELLELFRLRYQVYRNSDLARLVPENEYRIDLDMYDFRARHFGLFYTNEGSEQPIGYMRVVEDREVCGKTDVFDLVKRSPDLFNKLENTCAYPFPLMAYFPDSSVVKEAYSSMQEKWQRLVEPGRFALYRTSRFRRLGQHMIESAIAVYFFTLKVDYAMMCVDSTHKAIYGLYGFKPFAGTVEADFLGIGSSSVCLIGSPEGVPSPRRERLSQMAKAYQETVRICYHLCEPDHFFDLVQVDIFRRPTAAGVR